MPGYLEGYGVKEERRERIVKRILLTGLLLLVAGGALYYFIFRNYHEKQQAKLFFELLRKQNYQAAYRLWGCTEATPCRDYPMDRFMEDWGPDSPHANLSALRITKTRGCRTGVIVEIEFEEDEPEYLWVERNDRMIGFAPWPVCNPRLPTP
jgi:hypothetical protein